MSKFTDTYIKALKSSLKRYEEYEGGGFGIRVTPNGVKSWIYRYKIDGKTDKLTLGHYPTMSLANAKKRFTDLSGLRREGCNPKQIIEQEKQKESNTVEKLIQAWYIGYAEKNRKKPRQIKQQIDADIIPLLGRLSLDKIQTIDIAKALDKIVARGAPIHANRVLSTIKQAFNYGVSRGSLPFNPASGIRARDIGGMEKPRDRVLTIKEIKTIWLFFDSDKCEMTLQTRIAIKILLLSGVRTSELRLAKWDDIHWRESIWTIPATNSKAGLIHKVHLSTQTIALLNELREINHKGHIIAGSDSQQKLYSLLLMYYAIYDSNKITKNQQLSYFQIWMLFCESNEPLSENALARAINRIQERVKIPKWTAHDCRRSFATHLGETLRIDPVVIEKCLGHKMPRIMATYNKNEMLIERKEALDKWGQYVENCVNCDNLLLFKKIA